MSTRSIERHVGEALSGLLNGFTVPNVLYRGEKRDAIIVGVTCMYSGVKVQVEFPTAKREGFLNVPAGLWHHKHRWIGSVDLTGHPLHAAIQHLTAIIEE